ncbi:hypothetical protein BRC71_11570 [Halobacteriales archaeon QH_7_65_31]|nr:MAG: hypothetical protein BRC71_11570 [Halobacteriales archaeon QH_7_65_31]
MAAGQSRTRDGLLHGLKIDLVALHESWMQLVFPRQRGREHSVLGKWEPTTTSDRLKYQLWAVAGLPLVAAIYPFVLVGLAVRFYASRLDSGVARVGGAGILLTTIIVWGGLTVAARVQFGASTEGFYAVAAASVTAIVASLLALSFRRLGGRVVTIVCSYPFATTALFLPPVVAALYSPVIADTIFPRSFDLAVYFLDNVAPAALAETLRSSYDLEGLAYVIMWFGLAVPLGWLLGVVVTLANVVRPTEE